jgi:hypothetical protein
MSPFAQTLGFGWQRLRGQEDTGIRYRLDRKVVMSEANEFRLYAEEAMRESANAETEDERLALEDLACLWARAALVSEKVFEPSTGNEWRESPVLH